MDWSELEELVGQVMEARAKHRKCAERLETINELIPAKPKKITTKEEWERYEFRRNLVYEVRELCRSESQKIGNELRRLEEMLAERIPEIDVDFKLNGLAVKVLYDQYSHHLVIEPWREVMEVRDDEME